MSNESKQTKPDCPLIGEDGNVFHLVGIAARTLKRNGLSEQASEMTAKVFGSGSYDGKYEDIGIPSAGGTFSKDQRLLTAQQYDAEAVRDWAN